MDQRRVARRFAGLALVVVVAAAACAAGPTTTPPVTPGTSAQPRDVNVIARDDVFSPPEVDLVPGETVILHVVNGGLDNHEAVIGDQQVQDAWEVAEANAPPTRPGATPQISVPPGEEGLRIVVASGQRVDVTWTVPADAAVVRGLIVGCHVPGHYAKGMHVPVEIAQPPAAGAASASR
jgi:uncharacterized cupredoxin-like copper-binding protein